MYYYGGYREGGRPIPKAEPISATIEGEGVIFGGGI